MVWKGVRACSGPRVVIRPSTALFYSEFFRVFPHPNQVSITPRSTLIVEGDVIFQQLHLNGSLEITAVPGTKIIVNASSVSNSGHVQRSTGGWFSSPPKKRTSQTATQKSSNGAFTEAELMRGFVIEDSGCEKVSTKGEHGALPWSDEELKEEEGGTKKQEEKDVAVYYYNGVELVHSALYDDPSQSRGCFSHCCCARCLTCC